MPAPRAKLKIYSTTDFLPSADVRVLVGARREDFGSFKLYVVAPSKLKADLAIRDAYRGRALNSPDDLRVEAPNLDAPKSDDLDALIRAGYLADEGDVITTDRDHHRGVVLVRAAAEANGDPELVGTWEVAKDADDFPVRGFHRADGTVFAEPVDEVHKRYVLKDRAEKAAEAKLAADAPGAIERVEAFLAAREPDENLSNTGTVAVYVGVGERAELTVDDLRTLLAATRKLASR